MSCLAIEAEMEQTTDEIKRLQGCINDLISIQALPAIWSGQESPQIVGTLLDVLVRILRLDFAYVWLSTSIHGSPIEMIRLAQRQTPEVQAAEVGRRFAGWLTGDMPHPPFMAPNPIGEGNVSMAPFRLGLQDDTGILVAASRRSDFPTAIELILLRAALNQAVIGLQEARLLSEQRRAADELEERVVERTGQLIALNEDVKSEIIERERAEAALHESEQRLRAILENGPAIIFLKDNSGRYLDCNPPFEKLCGLRRDQIIGKSDWELFPREQATQFCSNDVEVLKAGRPMEFEETTLHSDGLHTSIVSKFPLRDREGHVYALGGLVADITERKRAEEELHTAREQLARASRVVTMGELTASIAHEVNQPLTAVVTNADAGLRWLAGATPNLEEAREALGRIKRDGNRASDVIARIRMLVRKTGTEKEKLDMNEVIQETVALAQGEMRRNGVTLRMELALDLPPVLGDRVQLQQVVLNLIMNGMEAMSAVADRPRELDIATWKDQVDKIRVTVKDVGVGLEPPSMERVFDAFYTTKLQGIGIGLSISRSIIEAHNGRLWAAHNDGPGATFQFTLPIYDAAAE